MISSSYWLGDESVGRRSSWPIAEGSAAGPALPTPTNLLLEVASLIGSPVLAKLMAYLPNYNIIDLFLKIFRLLCLKECL